MCGEAFWKRVVVFCLTFGLGVFIADSFKSNESPTKRIKITADAILKQQKCVPVDASLKYQNLAVKEEIAPPPVEENVNIDLNNQQIKKSISKDIAEKQKTVAEPKPQVYIPSQDPVEYQILLHKEKCFEADGPK